MLLVLGVKFFILLLLVPVGLSDARLRPSWFWEARRHGPSFSQVRFISRILLRWLRFLTCDAYSVSILNNLALCYPLSDNLGCMVSKFSLLFCCVKSTGQRLYLLCLAVEPLLSHSFFFSRLLKLCLGSSSLCTNLEKVSTSASSLCVSYKLAIILSSKVLTAYSSAVGEGLVDSWV